MAAASLQIVTQGRGPGVFPNMSTIEVTVTAVATVYVAASGGLPIDLTGVLIAGQPSMWANGSVAPGTTQALNPNDIVCILPVGLSTGGYLPSGFTLGAPTYTTPPAGQSTNDATANPGYLLTCPAWISLVGIGAANTNHAALGQVADGAVTDTVTFLLVINRNGANA